jgi:hypothetical protein
MTDTVMNDSEKALVSETYSVSLSISIPIKQLIRATQGTPPKERYLIGKEIFGGSQTRKKERKTTVRLTRRKRTNCFFLLRHLTTT